MAKLTPLPNPQWVEPEFCLSCGYLLTGLPRPGRCPECGVAFAAKHLVLWGVPRSIVGTSPARRLAWGVLIVTAAIYSQIFVYVMISHFFIAAALGLAIIGGLVALLLTSRRERRGTERLIISPAGIARLPLRDPKETLNVDSAMVPWGGATDLELTRISPVWYRLRVGMAVGARHIAEPILDAGIRCPDELADDVRRAVEAYLRRPPAMAQPPAEPS